jgi:hypothetical protein
VSALVRDHATRQAAADKQRAADAEAKAKAEREAAEKAAAELRAAQQAAEQAQAEAKAKQDQATAEAAAQALADLEAKQRAMVEQQARAEQAERERQRAEKAAKDQAERERKAAEKAAKAARRDQPATIAAGNPAAASTREQQSRDPKGDRGNPADQRGTVAGPLLKGAAEATPANLAESLAEQTEAGADPHETFQRYLSLVAAASWSDARMQRAAKAALVVLKRAESPSPVEVATAGNNGHVAAVA